MFRLPQAPVPASWWRRFHATMTALWLVAIVPSLLWWSESLKWIVLMSVWANVAGHFSAWQGTRAEANSESAAPQLPGGDEGPDQKG